MVRQLLNTSVNKIIGYDNSEIDLFNFKNELKAFSQVKLYLGDILDQNFFEYVIKKEKIDYIFHAAAFKHVGILQENIQSAIRNNIFGSNTILKSAKKNNIPIVTISTDKAVKPTSVLGLTKRITELLCLKFNDGKFSSKVVRFGNVFGSIGSAVPTFINQINNKMPITITHKNVTRYFMTTNEACFLLMSSMRINSPKNVLVLNMGRPIKILKIIESLINLRKKIEPDYQYEIKVIGLQDGEKMNEELTIKKRMNRTIDNDINIATDPIYQNKDIEDLLNKLTDTSDPAQSTRLMKNFLKQDFAK